MKNQNNHTQRKIGVSDMDPMPTPMSCHVMLTHVHWVKLKNPGIISLSNRKTNS